MSISDLTAVISPPAKPVKTGDKTKWEAIKQELKISLPDELYDLGHTYGTGRFIDGFVHLFNPFDDRYIDRIAEGCRDLEYKNHRGSVWVVPVYPEEGGLYPLGRDENGCEIFWRICRSTKLWPIALRAHGFPDIEEWNLPLTTFLAKAFNNEIKCLIWELFDKSQRIFEQKK